MARLPKSLNAFTGTVGAACVGTEWSRAHVQARISMPRPAQSPCRTLREARCRTSAKPDTPYSFCREFGAAKAPQQQLVVCHAVRAANNFPIAFRRQHVDAERQFR